MVIIRQIRVILLKLIGQPLCHENMENKKGAQIPYKHSLLDEI